MVKEFVTEAPSGQEEDNAPVDFVLDGVTLYARRPKMTAFMELARTRSSTQTLEQFEAFMRFAEEALIPESRDHVWDRLDDPDDAFDIQNLIPMLTWLMGEFTNRRPTGQPSASSGRRKPTGSRSTASRRSRASTSSPSPQSASATP